jgi:hypothetical protein
MPACCSERAETAAVAAISRKEARQAGGPSFREEALQEAPRLYFSDSTDLEKAVIIPIFRHKSWSLPDLPLWTTAARERRWPRPEEGCMSAASGDLPKEGDCGQCRRRVAGFVAALAEINRAVQLSQIKAHSSDTSPRATFSPSDMS